MAQFDFDQLAERWKETALATSIVFRPSTEDEKDVKICSVFFDDLSQVDKSRGTVYRLMLIKPFISTQENVRIPDELPAFDFFIFNRGRGLSAPQMQLEWAIQKKLGEQFLQDIENSNPVADGPKDIQVVGAVIKTPSHHEHKDWLIGTRFQGTVRIDSGFCVT